LLYSRFHRNKPPFSIVGCIATIQTKLAIDCGSSHNAGKALLPLQQLIVVCSKGYFMIDPSLCATETQDTLTVYWTTFSWFMFNVLATPALVIPLILGMIGSPWLYKSFRWKQQLSGLGVALLLVYLLILSPPAIATGSRLLVRFLPADSGMPVDAIVVLGRGIELRSERVDVAARLWQEQRSPLIFASGRGDAPEIVQMLASRGVAAQAIDGEPCSRTTLENAHFTAEILKPRGLRKILLVTDPPHMMRSLLIFRSAGFEVIPHPNPLPESFDTKKRAFLVFREYIGLASYGLLGRFSSPAAPPAAATG
jgi:uncharacterized SAM-binding protein YcdF (DUF218 family)